MSNQLQPLIDNEIPETVVFCILQRAMTVKAQRKRATSTRCAFEYGFTLSRSTIELASGLLYKISKGEAKR